MSAPEVKPDRLLSLWFAYAPPLLLESAIRFRVFDALEAGPRTLPQLADATGASPRGLRALLHALVALQFLTRQDDAFALAPESAAFLVSTRPGYLGGMFKHTTQILPNWLKLTEAVRTGRPVTPVNQESAGAEFFREFVEDLFFSGYPAARVMAENVLLPEGAARILDIAAGSGVWSIAAAKKNPQARVTVVDWPDVIPVCRKVTAREGVADRYDYIPGDLLEVDYGAGYHLATLGHIIHSEGAERSRTLLRKVHAALAPGGTIMIAEMVPDENRAGPPHALIFAVNMLVHTDDGDTFTLGEMTSWLHDAGFTDVRTLDVPAPSPLILATKK